MQDCAILKKALATSSTSTSFASKIPTITEPTGAGVHDLGHSGCLSELMRVMFYGEGADDTTFDVRIIGWDKTIDVSGKPLWVPQILCTLSCTLSTVVGIAGSYLTADERIADTLVVHATVAPQATYTDLVSAAAATRGTVEIFSPANNLVAWANVKLHGCRKVEFSFDMTGATNGNVLFRLLDQ
jgi:hypothetical protein